MMFIINRIFAILNYLAATLLLTSYLSPYVSPHISWHFAFLGLAFPVLVIINLCFIVFWLVQGKLKFILSFLCLLAGFSHLSKIYKFSGEELPAKHTGNVLKLVTFNVKGFGINDSKNFRDSLKRFVAAELPDIACFQEFHNQKEKNGLTTLDQFKKEGKFKAFRFNGIDGQRLGHGIVLFSQHPFLRSGDIEFESNSLNGAVWADVLFPGNDTIRVYAIHLQSNRLRTEESITLSDIEKKQEETVKKSKNIFRRLKTGFMERSLQVEQIREHLEKCPYKVILAGDFNDTQLSYTYKQLSEGMKDAFVESGKGLGNTYVGPYPSYRIDYIFFSNTFEGYNYTTQSNFLSDHKLIQTLVKYGK